MSNPKANPCDLKKCCATKNISTKDAKKLLDMTPPESKIFNYIIFNYLNLFLEKANVLNNVYVPLKPSEPVNFLYIRSLQIISKIKATFNLKI